LNGLSRLIAMAFYLISIPISKFAMKPLAGSKRFWITSGPPTPGCKWSSRRSQPHARLLLTVTPFHHRATRRNGGAVLAHPSAHSPVAAHSATPQAWLPALSLKYVYGELLVRRKTSFLECLSKFDGHSTHCGVD
jgi:hypothetical protein